MRIVKTLFLLAAALAVETYLWLMRRVKRSIIFPGS